MYSTTSNNWDVCYCLLKFVKMPVTSSNSSKCTTPLSSVSVEVWRQFESTSVWVEKLEYINAINQVQFLNKNKQINKNANLCSFLTHAIIHTFYFFLRSYCTRPLVLLQQFSAWSILLFLFKIQHEANVLVYLEEWAGRVPYTNTSRSKQAVCCTQYVTGESAETKSGRSALLFFSPIFGTHAGSTLKRLRAKWKKTMDIEIRAREPKTKFPIPKYTRV